MKYVSFLGAAIVLTSLAGARAEPIHSLPPVRISVPAAIKVANALLDGIEILLDGTDGGSGQVDKKGSHVKIGGKAHTFTLPHLVRDKTVGEMRIFINDVKSEIVHAKYLGNGVSRLTVVFESAGDEIKRVCKGCVGNDDDRAKDWDLDGVRLDIDFTLANHRTSSGKPSLTYNVKKVKLGADLDVPLLGEQVEDWFVRHIAPRIEETVAARLADYRDDAADLLWARLRQTAAYTDQLKARGIPLSINPAGISVSGDWVVVTFQ